ncbi:MAG: methyltransferase [Clostridia bacterium]|nr:methyltransferase [Clostridia bacterium]
MVNDNEHIEYLSDTLQLIVSDAHTFGTDALLLASFAMPKKNESAADLGAGCGIIPFYWLRGGCKGTIYGIDIQPNAYELMCRSVARNTNIKNFTPMLCDLRELQGTLPAGSLDVVVMNPPYKPAGTGILSSTDADQIARHETMCTLDDVCAAARRLLRYGGKFAVCLRPERLCDILCAMRARKLEPKRLRFVCQRPGLAPWLVLAEGRSGGKPGLTVLPTLYIESEEMRCIVGAYKKKQELQRK